MRSVLISLAAAFVLATALPARPSAAPATASISSGTSVYAVQQPSVVKD